MITGEVKNKIDKIWDTFWTGGITNPITIVEQMTYLFFMKLLDDAQRKKESVASLMGVEVKDPVFKKGDWLNPETGAGVPYDTLRWHVFKDYDPLSMFNTVRNNVFPFIKNMSEGRQSAYSRFMGNAIFMIPTEKILTKIVETIDDLDMNNRDAMGMCMNMYLVKWRQAETTDSSAHRAI